MSHKLFIQVAKNLKNKEKRKSDYNYISQLLSFWKMKITWMQSSKIQLKANLLSDWKNQCKKVLIVIKQTITHCTSPLLQWSCNISSKWPNNHLRQILSMKASYLTQMEAKCSNHCCWFKLISWNFIAIKSQSFSFKTSRPFLSQRLHSFCWVFWKREEETTWWKKL